MPQTMIRGRGQRERSLAPRPCTPTSPQNFAGLCMQDFAFLTAAGGRRILAVSIVPSQARLKPPPKRGHNGAYGSQHAHQSSHVRALVEADREATMYLRDAVGGDVCAHAGSSRRSPKLSNA